MWGPEPSKVHLHRSHQGGSAEPTGLRLDLALFLELVRAGDKYRLPLVMKQAGLAASVRVSKETVLEVFLELKKYGAELREARGRLAEFIKDNVVDMAY